LERAIEQAEGDNNQYDELAPGTQQVECEDIEEEQRLFFCFYPGNYMLKKFSLFYIQTSD
jgi:hypothetical protein